MILVLSGHSGIQASKEDDPTMLIGYVSDEYYAALADVAVELRVAGGPPVCVQSSASGAIYAELPAGECEAFLSRQGYGSKHVRIRVEPNRPAQFRLLSDRMLGYAWPKWVKAGEPVQFRLHLLEPSKVFLYRYGLKKEFIRNLGWYDNHGPRAAMQTLPDGFFTETGVQWDNGFGLHRQVVAAPERSGLYYFHIRSESGQFFTFPLVVAPAKPSADIAVLASTNTWNAYNAFGGRSNYIMASRMIDTPIVNSKTDLPRYRLSNYGEWKSGPDFAPLSFDRPEPYNHVPEEVECTDPIEGRQACHLAPAEWRTLGWLEQEGFGYDLYSDRQLHDGVLDLDQYRVLIAHVHPEYWSAEMYWRAKRWVFERGGRLMYLGGNGVNCEVVFEGDAMTCRNAWPEGKESRFHNSVESEANLLGVVYSDPGAMTVAPYAAIDTNHWVFEGTWLKPGDLFGTRTLHARYGHGGSGHETDKITPSSPKNIQLLAKGLNPDDGGAQMVLFDTPSGGQVFSAGSITFPTGLLVDPHTATITRNVLRRFLARG